MATTPDRITALARRHPLGLVWTGTLLYATSPVMVAATDVSGPVFAFWRLWFGIAIFATILTVQGRWRREDGLPVPWKWAVWSGLAFGLHQIFYASAVKATSVTDVSLISRLSPVIVGVAAVPLFDERPGRGFVVGAGIGIAGAAVVVLAGSRGAEGDPGGMALAVANVFAFSAWFLVTKASRTSIDVTRLLFGTFVVSAVMLSGYVAVAGESVRTVDGSDALLIAAVALIPGTLGHYASTWPLRWVPANLPPVIQLSLPILAGTMAWIFLSQGVSVAQVVGGVVTLLGILIAISSRSGRRMVADARRSAD